MPNLEYLWKIICTNWILGALHNEGRRYCAQLLFMRIPKEELVRNIDLCFLRDMERSFQENKEAMKRHGFLL